VLLVVYAVLLFSDEYRLQLCTIFFYLFLIDFIFLFKAEWCGDDTKFVFRKCLPRILARSCAIFSEIFYGAP
jgi:hypothetical protein